MSTLKHPHAGLSRRHAIGVIGGSLGAAALAGRAGAEPSAKAAPAKPVAGGAMGAKAGQTSGFYRFKIGAVEAISLSDGSGSIAPVQPLFAPEATPAEVNTLLTERFLPTDKIAVQYSVLCVKIGAETVLIDTGNGSGGGEETGHLVRNLAGAGISPDAITGIIISHAHGDHVGGLLDASGVKVFPNAECFITKTERDYWADPNLIPAARVPAEWKKGFAANARKALDGIKDRLELVESSQTLMGGLKLIDTHGHTPGHVSVLIDGGSESLLALSDTTHNATLLFRRPDWTVGFDEDPVNAVASRKRLFDRAAGDRLRCFGYHLPWPSVGHIALLGESYEWVPEPWQW